MEEQDQPKEELSTYQQSSLNFITYVPGQNFANGVLEEFIKDFAFINDKGQTIASDNINGPTVKFDGRLNFTAYRWFKNDAQLGQQTIPPHYSDILNKRSQAALEVEYTHPQSREAGFLDLNREDSLEKKKTIGFNGDLKKINEAATQWVKSEPNQVPLSAFTISFAFCRTQVTQVSPYQFKFEYNVIDANNKVRSVSIDPGQEEGEIPYEIQKINARLDEIETKVKTYEPPKLDDQGNIIEEVPKDPIDRIAYNIRNLAFDQTLTAEEVLIKVEDLLKEDEVLTNYRPLIAVTKNELIVPSSENPEAVPETQILDRAEIKAPCMVPSGEYKNGISKELALNMSNSQAEEYFKNKLADLQNEIFNPDKVWASGIGARTARRTLENGEVQTKKVSEYMVYVLNEIRMAQEGEHSWTKAAENINNIATMRLEANPKTRKPDTHEFYRNIKDNLFIGYELDAKARISQLKEEIFRTDWQRQGDSKTIQFKTVEGEIQKKSVPGPIAKALHEIDRFAKGEQSAFETNSIISKLLKKESSPKANRGFFGGTFPEQTKNQKNYQRISMLALPTFDENARENLRALQIEIIKRKKNNPHESFQLIEKKIREVEKGEKHYSEILNEIKNLAKAIEKKSLPEDEDVATQNFIQDIANGHFDPIDRIKATLSDKKKVGALKFDPVHINDVLNKAKNENIDLTQINDLIKIMSKPDIQFLFGDEYRFNDRVEAFNLLNSSGVLDLKQGLYFREIVSEVLQSEKPQEYAKEKILEHYLPDNDINKEDFKKVWEEMLPRQQEMLLNDKDKFKERSEALILLKNKDLLYDQLAISNVLHAEKPLEFANEVIKSEKGGLQL